jgi:hypothetical protein
MQKLASEKEAINEHEGHVIFPDEYLYTDTPSQLKVRVESGYVEFPEYGKEVDKRADGYFCGSCEYFEKHGMHKGWCKKLKINDRDFGCCNRWEHI